MDMLRVETVEQSANHIKLAFIGHMTRQHLEEMEGVLNDALTKAPKVLLDLHSLRLLDREAACFLKRWKARGVEIVNSPPFVARWVSCCSPK